MPAKRDEVWWAERLALMIREAAAGQVDETETASMAPEAIAKNEFILYTMDDTHFRVVVKPWFPAPVAADPAVDTLQQYLCRIEIETDGANPVEAAKQAYEILRAVDCTPWSIEVYLPGKSSSDHEYKATVDLASHVRQRDPWGSDPEYPREDWYAEAYQNNTSLGYWDWVDARRDVDAAESRREPRLRAVEVAILRDDRTWDTIFVDVPAALGDNRERVLQYIEKAYEGSSDYSNVVLWQIYHFPPEEEYGEEV